MVEKKGSQQRGEQPKRKAEIAQALARLAEMKQVADETTQALGLSMDLSPKVMRVIYSDLLPPEARGTMTVLQKEKEVFNRETTKDKNASENNPKH